MKNWIETSVSLCPEEGDWWCSIGESQGRFKVLHTYALNLASMLSLGPVIRYLILTKLNGK